MSLEQVLGVDREGNQIIITDENKFIPLIEFEIRFNKEFTYDALYNHENSTEMWRKLFDEWKQNGIIK